MHDLDTMYWQGYDKGTQQTLLELADIYEDIQQTYIWKEAFPSGDNEEDND